MKKKIAILLLSLTLAISVTACGRESEGKENSEPSNEKTVDIPDNPEESVDVPDVPEESVYFKDDVLKIDMATIKLTGFEVTPPNQDFGEEKSTLIITYEFTNDSDDVMQPGITWISCFNATQETDTTIDSLNVAMAPQDEKYTEMNNVSFTDVKPGATVQSVISYEINDTTKPIMLKATQGAAGDELGEKVYNLQ